MEKNVAALINNQINKEFYSAYLYLEMANFYDAKGLDGFANYFVVQAREEEDHAMIFYRYMHNSDEAVELDAIDKPRASFKDLSEPLDKAAEHEKLVTSLINIIYDAAKESDDYRTMQFLDWFVSEQAEEEKSSSDLVTRMKLFGKDGGGLYLLDKELMGRSYSAPDIDLD